MKMYNLWKTLVGSLQGVNDEGSSKRATAFGFFILSAILVVTYSSCYAYVVLNSNNTGIGTFVINQFEIVLFTVVGTLSTALGLTTFEKKVDAKKDVEIKKVESETNEG